MDRNAMPWDSGLAGFGLEREDHIKRVLGPTVPDPVIAMIGVITGVVVLKPVLYSFEIVCAFIAHATPEVSFVDRCVVCFLSRGLFLAPKEMPPTHLPPQYAQNILGMLSRIVLKNYKLRGD